MGQIGQARKSSKQTLFSALFHRFILYSAFYFRYICKPNENNMSTTTPFTVKVHPYRSAVQGSCAYEIGESSNPNALVFIGGLGDGPHSVPYVRVVAQHLEQARDLGYSMFELRLRSSFTAFGTSSLQNDVADISALVKYLRSIGKQKIVLLGHSTGCQVCD